MIGHPEVSWARFLFFVPMQVWRNAKSLGLRLVISLVEQLQGTIELDRTARTTFTIAVKEKECIT